MTPNDSGHDQTVAEMALFPEMNPGPVIRTDEAGVILLVNAAARELFAGEDLRGRRWLDVCPEVDRELWNRVLSGTDGLRHDAAIDGRDFIFTYRRPTNIPSVFIYGTDVTLLRQAEEKLRQAEKMAMLGTLAAGVAHELNNPAAAAARGASQLREAFGKLQDALLPLTHVSLTGNRVQALSALAREDREHAAYASHIDPLTRSDCESEVESWLEAHGISEAWDLAPPLVSLGYNETELDRLHNEWGDDTGPVLGWIARAQPVLALSREIEEATRRISEIVKSLKTYSFLGQAPVRAVDIIEGIESTLIILRNKLKTGIAVVREYEPDLPPVEAFGGELNQVWTNLIDNAADALRDRGTITIRARRDGEGVVVEIEDDGPGMPPNVRERIFDPFFTTKDPGKGTGLGLSTTRNIIEKKHGGTIGVQSAPGRTRFTIWLPTQVARETAAVSALPPDAENA